MIDVLIADDHPIVCKGVRLILDSSSDIQVVDEVTSIDGLLRKIRRNADYDVLLMDISRRNGEGTDLIRQLKFLSKQPILIFNVQLQEEDVLRMLKAGVSGYLTGESTPEELIAAIRKAANGKKHISAAIANQIAYGLDRSHNPHELLSDREYEVFHRLASGISVKRIAVELFLSEKTISTYRSRVLKKMKMETNCQLIRYAIKKGLVE